MRQTLVGLFRRRRAQIWAVLTVLLTASMVLGQLWPVYSSVKVESRMVGNYGRAMPQAFGSSDDPERIAEGGGLEIVLGEGSEIPTPPETVELAPAEPLGAEDVQAVIDRLPEMPAAETDQMDLRLPEQSLPPPRTGETITETFPATGTVEGPEEVVSGPLEVVRYSPEGEIRLAPFLNVTFNQPMVPVATIEQLAAMDVPVQITPEIPGIWKWIGTKTLRFEYAPEEGDPDVDRFPMATEFVVEVPAGTESATGGVLEETVRWTFTTPAPRLLITEPSFGPQRRDTLIFIAFDQRIQPGAVLETTTVTAGGREYALRLATEEEVAENPRIAGLVERAGEDRWVAFRATEEFPANTTVNVNVGPGTPSAEGPLTTTSAQSFSFTTYAPLRVDSSSCGYGSDCPPLSPFYIYFNNPIDWDVFDEAWVTVEPEIVGMSVTGSGTGLYISGATVGRTTYEVTISNSLTDVFGQTLGEDQTVTFTTGSAPRSLSGPNRSLVTLDPTSNAPVFTIYSINYQRLRLRVYAVESSDWTAYQEYLQTYYYDDTPPTPPGEEVMSSIFTVEGAEDELTETSIDLSEALDGETGHLIVVVDYPPNPILNRRDRNVVQAWVQVTQIGLDAFNDHSEMVAWTTALTDGTPLEGVEVSLLDSNSEGVTDADGIARLELPANMSPLVVATLGDDTAILPPGTYYWSGGGWERRPVQDELRWYVFDDRQMYRPGEEVHVKGWIRRIGATQGGDVGLYTGPAAVRWQVFDPFGNELGDGLADLNDLGGFDLAFTLPTNANLGSAYVQLSVPGQGGVYGTETYHYFQVQEFRRPEFEVRAQVEEMGPFIVGDDAVVAVNANYYAGGPLPNAETTWNVSASPGHYSPPNWPEFTFGEWIPWWWYSPEFGESDGSIFQNYTARTDASGAHYLRMDFVAAGRPQPYNVTAEAVVMDVNRQAWASTASLLVHPSELYVGLRSERYFVERGQPLEIDVIVTDIDGNAVAGRTVQVSAARLEWKFNKGQWTEEEADVQECAPESATEPVRCTFETETGGTYRITATVEDDAGRLNRTILRRWVSGGARPPARNVEQEEATLIPNKELYAPGDVAEILVQSPFGPAQGLLTLSRNGIVSVEQFEMTEDTHVLRIPIEDAHIPNLEVQVDLAGSAPRLDDQGNEVEGVPARPAFARGTLSLNIPPVSRTLSVTVASEVSALEPGGETTLEVLVRDAAGNPVENAEIAAVVVDESVLALTGYQLSNPISTFYLMRSGDVTSYYGRASIVLANPEELAAQMTETMMAAGASARDAAPMATMPAPSAMPAMEEAESAAMDADMAANGKAAEQPDTPIQVRSNFNPLATWEPATRTDAEGRTTVPVTLPDNLTRYRIMVVAVAEGKFFGSGESSLTARLPLMVRPSAPRFLNFGDRFELPVVVQNQTDEGMIVDIVVRSSNIELLEGAGKRVEVAPNDRLEVRFPATTVAAGTARFQVAAVSGEYADAANIDLPVYTPATSEAFATYGVIDEGAIAQPILAPTGVFPQFGGLEINTSSTALQALTDAVLYLVSYRYECSEQLASRILGIAALRDVLTAFEAEGLPSPEAMESAVARDIERLRQMQNFDGGFPVWTKGRESVPYYSIHVTHALQRARMKGFEVPEEMLQIALEHLREIESYYPYWYSPQTRRVLSAYALYVRNLMGDVDTTKARQILAEVPLEDHSLETIAWLWQVLSDDAASVNELEEIRRHVNNRAVETPSAASLTTFYGDDAYLLLHTNRRTDALVLDALINDQPDSDLIPKVVNGLLAHRTRGRWGNTQENVFILLALDRYFNTFESVTPDFVARIWLGETYAGEHEFEGRTTDTRETEIPMSYLVDETVSEAAGTTQDLIIQKDGEGRLYYRIGLRYAPDDLDLKPLDMGFVVQRSYEAVDDPEDVRLDENGVWHFKAGARVRVRIHMVAESRRYHVALVDPLPAGLEAINPALAVAESVPQDPNDDSNDNWWWWGPWYEHQNLRDERAEAFTTLLWEGVYDYTYVARATTPGEFVVPPAKAEEMYTPEVFGRSGSDRVIVE